MYTYRDRLMGGIYEVCRSAVLRYHDINTEFHKDWFRHSIIDVGMGIHKHTETQHDDPISLLLFFQNNENGLIIRK
jgi:hypothetical protein